GHLKGHEPFERRTSGDFVAGERGRTELPRNRGRIGHPARHGHVAAGPRPRPTARHDGRRESRGLAVRKEAPVKTIPEISDLEIHAYVDGELDASRARDIEGAASADSILAARIAGYRADKALL